MRKVGGWVIRVVCAVFSFAAEAELESEWSGYGELGASYGVDAVRTQPDALRGSQWMLDNLSLKYRGKYEKLTFHFDNALSFGAPTNSPTANYTNTSNFYSTKAQIRSGNLIVSNIGAFLTYKMGEKSTLSFGHLRTPFGIEGMYDRVDIPTYYYSNSYTAAQVFGWHYDFGVIFAFEDLLPGKIEVGAVDGRHPSARHTDGSDVSSPAFTFRYSHRYQSGDVSFHSAASLYMGRFRGRPGDIGFTLGSYMKGKRIRFDLEYLFTSTMTSYTSDQATANAFPGTEYVGGTTYMPKSLDILGNARPGHRAQAWSIYAEPGFAFTDDVEATAKIEYGNHEYEFAKEDINLAFGVAYQILQYAKLRFVYQHFNLLGNLASHAHDARLLFSFRY